MSIAEDAPYIGTRSASGGRKVMDTINRWIVPVFTAAAIFYLLVPILVMILFSFNDPPGRFNFVWGEFSLAAWANPFGRPGLQDAIMTSLVVAFVSTIISVALGTLIALALPKSENWSAVWTIQVNATSVA